MALNVDPVTALQNTTYTPKQGASQDLGQVDFMKLVIAQMQNQNPLDPQKDSDFMAQMAQFESLNQTKAMADGMKVMQSMQELSSATGMIGKTIIGKQVDAIAITRDQVGRELYGAPFAKLSSSQRVSVNADERVVDAARDAQNAGMEVSGKVDKVSVGPDGIPMLMVNGKVVDLFTVSEVR
jgi:flagellar hook assembly protein FlgD